MNRRDFFKAGLAGTTALAVPGMVSAGQSSLAGSVYYTKDNPGRWAKKIGGHLPMMKVNGSSMIVETDHGMSAAHYIVKHTLLDSNMNVIGEKMFDYAKDEAKSQFDIAGKSGTFYALSMCNKHDVWLNTITV